MSETPYQRHAKLNHAPMTSHSPNGIDRIEECDCGARFLHNPAFGYPITLDPVHATEQYFAPLHPVFRITHEGTTYTCVDSAWRIEHPNFGRPIPVRAVPFPALKAYTDFLDAIESDSVKLTLDD